MTNMTAC